MKITDHFRDLGLGGRIVLKWILEICIYIFNPLKLTGNYMHHPL
jgi:hypothetical protein